MSNPRPVFVIQIVNEKVVHVQCAGYDPEYFEAQIIEGVITLRNCIPKRRCCNKTTDWERQLTRSARKRNINNNNTPSSDKSSHNARQTDETPKRVLNGKLNRRNLRTDEGSIGSTQSLNNSNEPRRMSQKAQAQRSVQTNYEATRNNLGYTILPSTPEMPQFASCTFSLHELSPVEDNAKELPSADGPNIRINTSTASSIPARRVNKRRMPISSEPCSALVVEQDENDLNANNLQDVPVTTKRKYTKRKTSRKEAAPKPTPTTALHTLEAASNDLGYNFHSSTPEMPRIANRTFSLHELSPVAVNAIELPLADDLNISKNTSTSSKIPAKRVYKRRVPITSEHDNVVVQSDENDLNANNLQEDPLNIELPHSRKDSILSNNSAAPQKINQTKRKYSRHKASRKEPAPSSEDYVQVSAQQDENDSNVDNSYVTPIYIIPAKLAYVRRKCTKNERSSIPLLFDFTTSDNLALSQRSTPSQLTRRTPASEQSISIEIQSEHGDAILNNDITAPINVIPTEHNNSLRLSATEVRSQVVASDPSRPTAVFLKTSRGAFERAS